MNAKKDEQLRTIEPKVNLAINPAQSGQAANLALQELMNDAKGTTDSPFTLENATDYELFIELSVKYYHALDEIKQRIQKGE